MPAWLVILGPIVGLAGVGFGLYQWLIAQRWRKAEFAAAQLQRLSSDPALLACCRILDWRSRTVVIPERWRVTKDEMIFQHTWEELTIAMTPEIDRSTFNRTQAIYRDLFDEFFTYLEQVDHFIAIGLIRPQHVSSLAYWLEQISKPRFGKSDTFLPFLSHYGYDGVFGLMKRFGGG